ncbi:MAG: hypothetical protein K2I91_01060, partial [Muribaculaceae bacterium]|nr:hypothetical protein [Muribaculaceae bacterium]
LVYSWKYGILPNPCTTTATGEVDNLETLTLQLPEGFCFSSGYPIMSKFLPRVYLSNANGDMLEEAGYYGSVLNSDSWKGSDRIIYTDLTFTPENNEYYLIRFLPGILFLKDTDETMTSAEASLEMNFLYHYVRKSSAVTSPEGDALLDVHSIDGVRRKVERLDQLPRGLWIVNGKKIIL